MKRVYTIIVLIFTILLGLQAQNISVESFSILPHDLTANIKGTSRFDQNTRKNAALIKIETTQKGFVFEGGSLGFVGDPEYKTGEIWLYVPEGAKKLTLKHATLGVLRDYYYNTPIQSGKTYLMKLSTGKVVTHIEEDLGGNYVVMSVTPINSSVTIDNKPQEVDSEGNLTSFLPYGSHTYSVTANMYKTDIGTFTIDKEGNKNLTINLEPQFSYLQINSTPQGAEVYIDNSPTSAGVTPLKTGPIAYGKHTLQYRKSKYKDKYVEIEVATGGNTQNISHSLDANFATVHLTAPNNAEIYVNNEKKGVGSWSGELSAGDYLVEVRKESHHSTKTTINVQSGVSVNKTLEAPIPRYGILQIESSPIGSTIIIDGKEMGTTPQIIKNVLIGERKISIKKQGYTQSSKNIIVEEGKVTQEKFTLQKEVVTQIEPQQTTNNSFGNSHNGHEFVDLGLPSGIKWATCNIGANKPEEFGSYFAWGETTQKNSAYNWSTYKYCKGTENSMTKYSKDRKYGVADNITTLELSDDAANVNWGGNWRTPKDTEFNELKENCKWEWTKLNGIIGYKVTSKINGNSIFLPAAGEHYNTSLLYDGEAGHYWTSNADISNGSYFYKLESNNKIKKDISYRYDGMTVRAVCDSKTQPQQITNNIIVSNTTGNNYNGHEYVDLGLPSGRKWATCNIGANKPEDAGNYFAWGETTQKNSAYNWNTYKYCKGTEKSMTKYSRERKYGVADNITTLELSDDAANVNWGGNWRTPTDAEFLELKENCTWKWGNINGVYGYKVTSKINGNSIFLPAAGEHSNVSLLYKNTRGMYWTSSLGYNCSGSYYFNMQSENKIEKSSSYRYNGMTIRAVW